MSALTTTPAIRWLERARWLMLADCLGVALAISLPWSTSATSILVGAWLFALIPALDLAVLRRTLLSPAGGLPVLLALLGTIGMFWADTSGAERLAGAAAYQKFLAIPLLLAQFRQSQHGPWVIKGFLASAVALMALSWLHAFTQGRTWLPTMTQQDGVPVKDYITQSAIFQLCVFGLAYWTSDHYRTKRQLPALLGALVSCAFFANIVYIATSRTTLIVMPVLLLLLGLKRRGVTGVGFCLLAGAIVAGIAWGASPYLRDRVNRVAGEVKDYRVENTATQSGARLEFWKKSLIFIAQAPVLGHGTGSIHETFRRAATGQTGASSVISSNPHQQTLAVGIELGAVGILLLFAFWIAHLALFSGSGLAAWCGLSIVVQNVIASQLNSHLFDFTEGWLYVLGVGVLGGLVLGGQDLLGSGGAPDAAGHP
jgi:O-antigen ligase